MSMNQPSNTRDAVHWAADQFEQAELCYGHGTDNALDEAAFLVAHALHVPWDFEGFDVDGPMSHGQWQSIQNIITQRITQRLPAPYLTHEAWFAEMPFYVDARVLVPRSPMAELIMDQFQPWIDLRRIQLVLDMGTGSGCIAIATAMNLPGVTVDATDVSVDALAVAQLNIDKHGVSDRVRLIQSDLFEQLPKKFYDIIISNPPYVDAHDMATLPNEFQHEPALGLTAGDDGLDCVRRILHNALAYLQPHGILIVEVGNSAEALQLAFPEVPFTWLEFEHGDDGVFLLDAQQLKKYRHLF